jgi:hypothetical protein
VTLIAPVDTVDTTVTRWLPDQDALVRAYTLSNTRLIAVASGISRHPAAVIRAERRFMADCERFWELDRQIEAVRLRGVGATSLAILHAAPHLARLQNERRDLLARLDP